MRHPNLRALPGGKRPETNTEIETLLRESKPSQFEDYDYLAPLLSRFTRLLTERYGKLPVLNAADFLKSGTTGVPDSATQSQYEGSGMSGKDDFGTLFEKLDQISSQHQAIVHNLETRVDNKIADVKGDFVELRRDMREDIKDIKDIIRGMQASISHIDTTVSQARDANRHMVIAIILGSLGIALTVFLSVIYGSWTILGTLKAFIPTAH